MELGLKKIKNEGADINCVTWEWGQWFLDTIAEQKIIDKGHDLVHNAQKNIIENAARDAMPSCPGGICEPVDIDVENYLVGLQNAAKKHFSLLF